MNNKQLEEKIIALAYGELDSSEVEQVRSAIADSEDAARLFEEFRSCRDAMSLLPAAPSASLGTERLRQRILSRTLRRPALRWGWACGAAAVAASMFAAFYFVNRSQTSSDLPMHVSNPGIVADNSRRTAAAPAIQKNVEPMAPIEKPTVTKRVSRSHRVLRSRSADVVTAASDSATVNASSLVPPAADKGASFDAAVATNVPKGPNDSTIVLISSGERGVAGTSRAVETDSDNGITIGG
jgi:anti-sigma factor RsiW